MYFLTFCLFALSKHVVIGKIYQLSDIKKTNQLMTYERVDELKDGWITGVAVYKNPDGTVALRETTVYKRDTLEIKDYVLENLQLNYTGQVITSPLKKVTINLTSNKSKKSTKTEKQNLPVIVSSLLTLFAEKHWKKLSQGKTVKFRLAVVDRLETIGFEFKKVSPKKIGEKKYTTIRMSPSSWLISQVVDDIFLLFDEKNNIKKYQGRVTPKIKKNGKWKDLDASIYY